MIAMIASIVTLIASIAVLIYGEIEIRAARRRDREGA